VDVIAFGSIFLELVFGTLEVLPQPGEEIFADQFEVSCGGALSVVSAARGVGATAALATVLGDDLGSRVGEAHCARVGVDLSVSRRVAGKASGVTVVLNFEGDRAFISYLPDRPEHASEANAWWSDVVRAQQPAWIYLSAKRAALPVVAEARRLGCRVAMDTELATVRDAPELVRECAALSDLFLPNRSELSHLTGTDDLATSIKAIDAPNTIVVVKEGAQGAVVASGGLLNEVVAGLDDVDVQDRTGAGDAFAGALIGSLAQDRSIEAAVEAGNAAGSAAVARLGAVGAVMLEI